MKHARSQQGAGLFIVPEKPSTPKDRSEFCNSVVKETAYSIRTQVDPATNADLELAGMLAGLQAVKDFNMHDKGFEDFARQRIEEAMTRALVESDPRYVQPAANKSVSAPRCGCRPAFRGPRLVQKTLKT